jgi:hypothetical protein
VLFEYDYKAKTITHYFDAAFLVEGKNDLKIEVSDNLGILLSLKHHFSEVKRTKTYALENQKPNPHPSFICYTTDSPKPLPLPEWSRRKQKSRDEATVSPLKRPSPTRWFLQD